MKTFALGILLVILTGITTMNVNTETTVDVETTKTVQTKFEFEEEGYIDDIPFNTSAISDSIKLTNENV